MGEILYHDATTSSPYGKRWKTNQATRTPQDISSIILYYTSCPTAALVDANQESIVEGPNHYRLDFGIYSSSATHKRASIAECKAYHDLKQSFIDNNLQYLTMD